jgi:hypothetical protein
MQNTILDCYNKLGEYIIVINLCDKKGHAMDNEGGSKSNEDNSDLAENITDRTGQPDQNIIDYLNEEIEHIRSEKLEPGWTVWAIIATISSLAWLLLDEIESHPVHMETILFLLGIASYLLIISSEISSVVVRQDKGPSETRFKLMGSFLKRLDPLVFIVRHLAIIGITFLLHSKVNPIVNILAYALNLYLIGLILFIWLSVIYFENRINLFTKAFERVKRFNLDVLIIILISAYVVWSYISAAIANHLPVAMSDIRIVGIVFGILYLARVLSRIQTKSPFLEQLIEIRRNYRLGKIDTPTTKRRIDETLFGLSFQEVTRQHVGTVVLHITSAEQEVMAATKTIGKLDEYYTDAGSKLSKGDQGKMRALNKATFTHLKKFSSIMRHRTFFAFRRLAELYKDSDESATDPNGLGNIMRITDRISRNNEGFLNAKSHWVRLLKAHEKKEIAEKWIRKLDTLTIYELSVKVLDEEKGSRV